MTRPIKVLIVDDSPVALELLRFIIESDPDLKVIGTADSGEKAIELLTHLDPDVITMDIVMPRMNGFEVTRQIMHSHPIPIIVVSGDYTPENVEQSFLSMEAGALAILPKPVGVKSVNYQQQATQITETIKAVAEIKLAARFLGHNHLKDKHALKAHSEERASARIDAVAIGASLGGPQALCEILSALPKTFEVPIFIVQHISPGFSDGLVSWLQQESLLKICLAEDKQQAVGGTVYIAPDGYLMEITKGNIIQLTDVNGMSPSVATLFSSMAKVYGPHGIGVILTGMGHDGAKELLLMRQKGAYTIAQDEESSIMFGMPKEAIALGAAISILPLQQIAPTLEKLVTNSKLLHK